jgi:hypothetical protein
MNRFAEKIVSARLREGSKGFHGRIAAEHDYGNLLAVLIPNMLADFKAGAFSQMDIDNGDIRPVVLEIP